MVEAITPGHFIELKQKMAMRGSGFSNIGSRIFAMKCFLRFCRETMDLNVVNPEELRPPKRVRREVIFLSNEEVRQFVDSIKIYNTSLAFKGTVNVDGLRFRTLVEVLLGTGVRISECLSLNRDSINFEKGEAKIIGKGNKERTVFFTKRSLFWIEQYLAARADDHPALFVSQGGGSRLARADIWRPFARHRKLSGINKRVSAHLMRHTAATQLLFNGCPVGHIKEILGHERLETTCRYYLGLDHRAAKEAHQRFLRYEIRKTYQAHGPFKVNDG